ncbi:hypothetical protein IOD16_15080 [Saccharothrix sp. 6-C]|uniref:Uncharacterized protein n=1 Tax=Saccharothrix texasensis TaxID=103734 RepID=A0A3N1GYP1_9PSEU|nr:MULTISPECIES: hypothetical protein [Saccharothrix]QQQ79598.1 hypothetical protein IOD16_15080 [Saccharothrix sp. 6-C]ROP35142.1 hypothetical protein EDD40_0363 [Saccharothrix texasensis]
MTKAQRIVAAWADLPAPELTDQVRLLVKARDAGARAVWSAVREDNVVAARVRGALAGLKAEYRGHRDEAMWLMWIGQAQQQLAVQAAAPVVEPVVEDVTPELEPVVLQEWAPRPEPTSPRPAGDAPPVLFQEPASSAK